MKKILGILLLIGFYDESSATLIEQRRSPWGSVNSAILIRVMNPFSIALENNSRQVTEAKIFFTDNYGNEVDDFSRIPDKTLAPGEKINEQVMWYGNSMADSNPNQKQKFFACIKYSNGKVIEIPLEFSAENATFPASASSLKKNSQK
ncbi:MAG: hypothetical protein LBJ45_00565 [Holosporaceae bacterium]|jgi:hypothetical protein|nr:hypothetical protein [Holosporaceae bacterium]